MDWHYPLTATEVAALIAENDSLPAWHMTWNFLSTYLVTEAILADLNDMQKEE